MFENTYHDILTVDEVCEILFISRNTCYDLLRTKKLHSFKVGRIWRIPLDSVKDFVGYKPTSAKLRFSL